MKRYKLDPYGNHYNNNMPDMVEDPDGEWVRYEDIKITPEPQQIKEELERLEIMEKLYTKQVDVLSTLEPED